MAGRSPEEERFINRVTFIIFAALAVCVAVPVLAIVGALSWKLFLWIAGA